jgi:hypothetical protein
VSFNHAIASATALAHRWAATPDTVADAEPEAARRAGGSR